LVDALAEIKSFHFWQDSDDKVEGIGELQKPFFFFREEEGERESSTFA
jgi:hypothetical protein